jgi:hypothetical protein
LCDHVRQVDSSDKSWFKRPTGKCIFFSKNDATKEFDGTSSLLILSKEGKSEKKSSSKVSKDTNRPTLLSPPPDIGGSGHFLCISRKEEHTQDHTDPAYAHQSFLQAADVKPTKRRSLTPKVEIIRSHFEEPAKEMENSYTAELKLDTPNAISVKLLDKSTIMCLVDTGAMETLIFETGTSESNYIRSAERIKLKKPKKFIVGNEEYIIAKSIMKFQIRSNSVDLRLLLT